MSKQIEHRSQPSRIRMPLIRLFQGDDWPATWAIVKPVFRAGRTYVYPRGIHEEEARRVWVDAPTATYVVEEEGEILGTYYLKPNQPGRGGHVCNCGYIVSEPVRGRGIASMMCEHSQAEAVAHGFRGMQYNLVVSTNQGAIRLWKKLGFRIVGTVPGAFRDAEQGYVDAYVMFKELIPGNAGQDAEHPDGSASASRPIDKR